MLITPNQHSIILIQPKEVKAEIMKKNRWLFGILLNLNYQNFFLKFPGLYTINAEV
jgi:hypothetical protein